jgi:integrase
MHNEELVVGRPKQSVIAPKLQKRNGIWHVAYTHPSKGTTYRKSTGTRNRSEALKRMHGIVDKLIRSPVPTGLTYRVGEILSAYELSREGRIDSTHYALKRLHEFFSGFNLDQLNDAAWRSYRRWRTEQANQNAALKRQGRPITDATACRELHTMRAALHWARRNGWQGLETINVHIPNEPHGVRHDYLTRDEVRRLVRACATPHQKLFVLLAVATGARMSALLELKWEDVHWTAGLAANDPKLSKLVTVNVSKTPPENFDIDAVFIESFDFAMSMPIRVELGQGHRNKKRGTGMISKSNTVLIMALAKAYESRKTDFVIEHHGRSIKKIDLTKAYRRAGLKHIKSRAHVLKHTCCSWLVQAGARFEDVAKLIGTTGVVIERHYGHLSPRHLETLGDKLSISLEPSFPEATREFQS